MACIFTAPFLTGQLQNKAHFMPQQALQVQIFNCFFYFILYGIFERIIPSDSSIKDPLFNCLKRHHRSQDQTRHDVNSDHSSALHHEIFHNTTNLKKNCIC